MNEILATRSGKTTVLLFILKVCNFFLYFFFFFVSLGFFKFCGGRSSTDEQKIGLALGFEIDMRDMTGFLSICLNADSTGAMRTRLCLSQLVLLSCGAF